MTCRVHESDKWLRVPFESSESWRWVLETVVLHLPPDFRRSIQGDRADLAVGLLVRCRLNLPSTSSVTVIPSLSCVGFASANPESDLRLPASFRRCHLSLPRPDLFLSPPPSRDGRINSSFFRSIYSITSVTCSQSPDRIATPPRRRWVKIRLNCPSSVRVNGFHEASSAAIARYWVGT